MATLKEAVESGRRWRHGRWRFGIWHKAGDPLETEMILIDEAISSDFEIEPEPEKPREWFLDDERLLVFRDKWQSAFTPPSPSIARLVRVHDADECERSRR